jgi:hypothetical protein
MSKAEIEYTQPIGLDVGTSRIVVARTGDKKPECKSQLNAFLTLPHSRLAESLLQRESVFHEVRGSEILVAGNDAQKFAEVFHVELRRPMLNGVLNPLEPHSLSVVRMIVGRLVGPAGNRGQRAFFSIPSAGAGGEAGIHYHEASLRQILTDLNYQATPIEEGLAVVFGELGNANYTGIGVSCGSGLHNFCLAVLSVPVITFSAPKAGDFIDAQASLVTGELATRLRIIKEQSFALGELNGDRVQNALTVYYHEIIDHLVDNLRDRISSSQRLPKLEQSIPLVLAGGTAMPAGFVERFRQAIEAAEFPVKISEVRMAADPLTSTARGALMAALC